MKNIRFTKQGFEALQKEREDLLKERPVAVEHLRKAREMGDLKENGYYRASKSKLVEIDRRLTTIAFTVKQAEVIEVDNHAIGVGNTITIQDQEKELTYTIVGDLEANPSERKISLLSPLGKVVEGKKVGDAVDLILPMGTKTLIIKAIS